jgi:hypothetical protein
VPFQNQLKMTHCVILRQLTLLVRDDVLALTWLAGGPQNLCSAGDEAAGAAASDPMDNRGKLRPQGNQGHA